MTGLEALNRLLSHIETEAGSDEYYECKEAFATIEKELKKLSLLKR